MGQAESARRDAVAAGEFVTVNEGSDQADAEDNELNKEQVLQQLNMIQQSLPLLRTLGEHSWGDMLSESMASVADRDGVGSINAGGIASILDSYKDWATRRLLVVDQAQRDTHFQIMNTESQLNRARKAFYEFQQSTNLAADQLVQVTLLAKEVQQVKVGVETAVADYNRLLADLDERLLLLETDCHDHLRPVRRSTLQRQYYQSIKEHRPVSYREK
mmetsp:Transcript_25843/g.49086  ORF Transcript_25843/g.49086 Transcript_25843/m.49086 type:complete len:217 (-) Transcript_25843:249-899(-)